MKYLVETTGEFMLVDPTTRQEVQAHRPSVISPTPFFENQLGKKLTKLKVLSNEADDTMLAAARTEKALQAAIQELPEEVPAEAPAPAAPKGRAAKQ